MGQIEAEGDGAIETEPHGVLYCDGSYIERRMNGFPSDDHHTSWNTVRFSLAGLEVLLRSPDDALANLSPSYAAQGAARDTPDLVLEIRRVVGLGAGAPRPPRYPEFARSRTTGGAIRLHRPDATGEVALPLSPAEPVRGSFVVGESRHSLDAVLRASVSIAVPRNGGLILHASAVDARGAAYVFSGVSGAGKSTIATLLGGLPGFTKIADDLVIVMPHAGGFALHTVPFLCKEARPPRHGLPGAGGHALAQRPAHRRERLAPAAATRELLRHVLAHVVEPQTAASTLAAALAFTTVVPCHRLEFARAASVVDVLDIT